MQNNSSESQREMISKWLATFQKITSKSYPLILFRTRLTRIWCKRWIEKIPIVCTHWIANKYIKVINLIATPIAVEKVMKYRTHPRPILKIKIVERLLNNKERSHGTTLTLNFQKRARRKWLLARYQISIGNKMVRLTLHQMMMILRITFNKVFKSSRKLLSKSLSRVLTSTT